MPTITIATTARRQIACLELPRTYMTGEFPTAEIHRIEDTEANRIEDYKNLCKRYGRDCNVFQREPSGKIIRDNDVDVNIIEQNLTEAGF